MTKRENILLKVLIIISIIAIFYLTNGIIVSKKENSLNTINKYTDAISKIRNTQPASNENKYKYSIPQITDIIQNALLGAKITPDSYQLFETGEKKYVEFTISCDIPNFTDFLYLLNENKIYFNLFYISLKASNQKIKAIMRFSNEEIEVSGNTEKSQKQNINKILGYKSIPVNKKENIKTEVPLKIIDGEKKYKIIGNITDNDNQKYIYIKNEEIGKVHKISEKKLINQTENYIIIQIENEMIKVKK